MAINISFTAMSISNLILVKGECQPQATFPSQNINKQSFKYDTDTNIFSIIKKWFSSFIHGLINEDVAGLMGRK
jgi:hypothetical protein